MPRVTEVRKVGRSARRYAVLVEGEVALEVDVETLARFGVAAGRELTAERIAEIRWAEERLQASLAAGRLLKHRGRSRVELARALRRRGHSEEAVAVTLDRLAAAGLINDAVLAGQLAEGLRERKLGTRLVRQKMLQAGLGRELTEATLAELGEQGEVERALALAEKYVVRAAGDEPLRLRRRLYGYLARRGFDDAVCRQVLETLVSEPD